MILSKKFQSIEGFIKIPDNVEKIEFYEELSRWIKKRGGDFLIDQINMPPDLEIQRAQHVAIFDKSKKNRYTLRVNWEPDKNKVAILMMNPSHATALISDITVTFMIEYAIKHFDAGGVWIVNMSPFIDPKSKNVDKGKFTDDCINKDLIKQAIEWSNIAFLAWGDNGGEGVKVFGKWFEDLMKKNENKLRCFRQTKKGNPIHRNGERPPINLDRKPQPVDLNMIFH